MLLQQYFRGDKIGALQALRLMGELECSDADAVSVARETMKRVRSNIEVLVQRLDTIGCYFQDAEHAFFRERRSRSAS